MNYRCVAASQHAFITQLAVQYVAHGYWWYISGQIPEKKDPTCIDRSMIEKYGLGLSRSARYHRKRNGGANVQYLRYGRDFVLVATQGHHRFYRSTDSGGESRRDPRTGAEVRIRCLHHRRANHYALHVFGHTISYRGGHACVRMSPEAYQEQKAMLLELATNRTPRDLGRMISALPYVRFEPVCEQVMSLWRTVCRARKVAGLQEQPPRPERFRRWKGQRFVGDPDSLSRTMITNGGDD